MKKTIRILLVAVLLLILIFTAVACSAKEGEIREETVKVESEGTAVPGKAYSAVNRVSGADSTSRIIITEDRLIVYTVDMSITVDEYDASVSKLHDALSKTGGYESRSSERSSGVYEFTFRVPTEKLNDFLAEIEGTGKVEEKVLSTVDITERYVNAQSEKEALEFKKSTLEALFDEATTFAEKVDITDRILDVSRQIDSYSKTISNYKKEADYSTVNVSLYKEWQEEEEEPSFWEHLGEVFSGSGKSIGVLFGAILSALVAIVPYIGLVAVLFGLYVLIKFIVCRIRKVPFTLFKKLRERRAKRKAKKAAKEAGSEKEPEVKE